MEKPINKNRTPSRCREWERQRRNKFNAAISQLAEIIKDASKTVASVKDDNTQYPKIEIIQKAIVCLTNYKQEITQLKAKIMVLQVGIEVEKSKCNEQRKDASTQVHIGIKKKGSNVKILMLETDEKKEPADKPSKPENSLKDTTNHKKSKPNVTNTKNINFTKILPRSNTNIKKGTDSTIVVLPATPYIFSQRPFLLPTVPPAIVLLDHHLQGSTKNPVPIVNKTGGGDITKTTMVNILPISAYSHPLSVCKTKKSIKPKKDNSKLSNKKTKPKVNEESSQINKENIKEKPKSAAVSIIETETIELKQPTMKNIVEDNTKVETLKNTFKESNIKDAVVSKPFNQENESILSSSGNVKCKEIFTSTKEKTSDKKMIEKEPLRPTIKQTAPTEICNTKVNNEKHDLSEKQILVDDKLKGNKLTSILDTSLCDSNVDAGNARLELAEEFLAASPTAAFLMSFPLVSGNRADSPAEENQNVKESIQRRCDVSTPNIPYYDKANNEKSKELKLQSQSIVSKSNDQQKFVDNSINRKIVKTASSVPVTTVSNENPFLNLSMPSLVPISCSMSDSTFGLDFDCNSSKTIPNHSSNLVSNSNIFFKSDPFSTVKSTIYSTSSIPSGHEFNNLSLYPCAMEKYSSKSKPDFTNVEDSLMKIGSSRLTYDIDLGWSHKGFDFVNCTNASNNFNKDNILTTVSTPYSTSYNPFNPEFHVPLVSSSSKKDISKVTTSFGDSITSLYSQPTSLWSEDLTFYTNSNINKTSVKHHNFMTPENVHSSLINKISTEKRYEPKQIVDAPVINNPNKSNLNFETKSNVNVDPQMVEKYTKKSPSKMHINWMTSEIRPMQTNCNPVNNESKEHQKNSLTQLVVPDTLSKKLEPLENNYFNLPVHNFTSQSTPQDEFQMWPSARPLGTTEISMEPPPINLPTLVGDLALGPHEKKKNAEFSRTTHNLEAQHCSNFLSVAQIMNRTVGNLGSQSHVPSVVDIGKTNLTKQNTIHYNNDAHRKNLMTRQDANNQQPCYNFNETRTINPSSINPYENMNHFPVPKNKSKTEPKSVKTQKNSYSAEALIRGGTCNPKVQDNPNPKYAMPAQKYEFNSSHDNSIAQVSHFPPILDYPENGYSSQQFSGTTLYNSTTNTISNSFYSNFMPGSGNLMSTNYTSGPFTSEYIDYNQSADCNFTNQKYEELKIRNNQPFHQEKSASNYKGSRRESAPKHKLECSKKETNKKYHSKRAKLNAGEVEDWNDGNHLNWQSKTHSKRHGNVIPEEHPFPNYVGNQMPTQFQPDLFNSHLMPSNVQSVGHNVDRSLSNFPVTSRANFNLSSIFPEITMKVQ